MKAQLRLAASTLVVGTLLLLRPGAGCAQTNTAAQPHAEHGGQVAWGEATQGIRAGVSVDWNYGRHKPPCVGVYVSQVPKPSVNASAPDAASMDERGMLYFGGEDVRKPTNRNNPRIAPQYYQATNSFCGPIELRDELGRQVASLQPTVSSPKNYPASYSLTLVEGILAQRNVLYSGPPMPTALMTSVPQLARFQLQDHFAIKGPGEYHFVVWAKVYKRVSRTNDLCERIDLPPVSVAVKWEGQAPK
jgi:hypothetical protein